MMELAIAKYAIKGGTLLYKQYKKQKTKSGAEASTAEPEHDSSPCRCADCRPSKGHRKRKSGVRRRKPRVADDLHASAHPVTFEALQLQERELAQTRLYQRGVDIYQPGYQPPEHPDIYQLYQPVGAIAIEPEPATEPAYSYSHPRARSSSLEAVAAEPLVTLIHPRSMPDRYLAISHGTEAPAPAQDSAPTAEVATTHAYASLRTPRAPASPLTTTAPAPEAQAPDPPPWYAFGLATSPAPAATVAAAATLAPSWARKWWERSEERSEERSDREGFAAPAPPSPDPTPAQAAPTKTSAPRMAVTAAPTKTAAPSAPTKMWWQRGERRVPEPRDRRDDSSESEGEEVFIFSEGLGEALPATTYVPSTARRRAR
jgi:hypothetical protein